MMRFPAVRFIDKEFFQNSDAVSVVHEADASCQNAVLFGDPERTASLKIGFTDGEKFRLVVDTDRLAAAIILAVKYKLNDRILVGIFKYIDFYHK